MFYQICFCYKQHKQTIVSVPSPSDVTVSVFYFHNVSYFHAWNVDNVSPLSNILQGVANNFISVQYSLKEKLTFGLDISNSNYSKKKKDTIRPKNYFWYSLRPGCSCIVNKQKHRFWWKGYSVWLFKCFHRVCSIVQASTLPSDNKIMAFSVSLEYWMWLLNRACHRNFFSKFEFWGVVSEYIFVIEITFILQTLTKNGNFNPKNACFSLQRNFENIQRKICQFSILALTFQRMV